MTKLWGSGGDAAPGWGARANFHFWTPFTSCGDGNDGEIARRGGCD